MLNLNGNTGKRHKLKLAV